MTLADTPPTIKPRRYPLCGIAKLGYNQDDLNTIRAWCDDPQYTDQAIADRLNLEPGAEVSHQIVARHRLKKCSCDQ